jgi:hypothetical protein
MERMPAQPATDAVPARWPPRGILYALLTALPLISILPNCQAVVAVFLKTKNKKNRRR